MSDTTIIERDGKGRFLTGTKPGPGRAKGSRNRHTENFLAAFADDFQQHGAKVIEQVRVDKPDVYLRIAADLLPRQAQLDVDVSVLHQVGDVLEAYRLAADLLGVDPAPRLRQLRRIEHDAFER